MNTLLQESEGFAIGQDEQTNPYQERLRETICFLEKLSLDHKTIANQKIELADALLRISTTATPSNRSN